MATQVSYIVRVSNVVTRLNVREGPGIDYAIITKLTPGTENINVSQEDNGWYFLTDYNGWSNANYLEITANNTTTVTTPDVTEVVQEPVPEYTVDDAANDYLAQRVTSDNGIDGFEMKSLRGIWGAPYQFMNDVDLRYGDSKFGRTYGSRIIARMPLLLIAPGKVDFAGDYESKYGAAGKLLQLIEDTADDVAKTINEVADQGQTSISRYYTFDFDYEKYYKYVNAGLTAAAQYLGIADVEIDITGKDEKIGNINWADVSQTGFKTMFTNKEYVGFFVDSVDSKSEDMSNSTTQSELLSGIQSLSAKSRELQFLTGITTGKDLNDLGIGDATEKGKVLQSVDQIQEKYFKNNNVLKNIASNFTTLALGGQLIFPEIWDSSEYGSNFSASLKLVTNDCDNLSWYLNIFVPLYHLICLTAPRQADNPNGYASPFIVRGFLKGVFNCDMGMVSLSITKGRESAWTVSGLPTEIDVDISIKDLYTVLSITDSSNPGHFVNNIGLMSYIANTCGMIFVENDIERVCAIYCLLQKQKWVNLPSNTWNSVENWFTNYKTGTQNVIRKFLDNF